MRKSRSNDKRKESNRQRRKRQLMSNWHGLGVERNFDAPKKIGDVLTNLLEDLNLKDQLDIDEVRKEWSTAVEEPFKSGTRPVALRYGVLMITVSHPTLHFSIRGLESDLLKVLQSHFGKKKIKKLKFQHGF